MTHKPAVHSHAYLPRWHALPPSPARPPAQTHNALRSLPDGLTRLARLRSLLANDNVFKEVPPVVCRLASLEQLWLNLNPITTVGPLVAARLPISCCASIAACNGRCCGGGAAALASLFWLPTSRPAAAARRQHCPRHTSPAYT